jgi:hypothetical protein
MVLWQRCGVGWISVLNPRSLHCPRLPGIVLTGVTVPLDTRPAAILAVLVVATSEPSFFFCSSSLALLLAVIT